MSYIVTGSCNGCGKCCLGQNGYVWMGNPLMVDPQTGICWFYDPTANSGGFGCCRLYDANQGTYKKIPLRTSEPDGDKCTLEMFKYCRDECKKYPNLYTIENLKKLLESAKPLPDGCSYTIEEI